MPHCCAVRAAYWRVFLVHLRLLLRLIMFRIPSTIFATAITTFHFYQDLGLVAQALNHALLIEVIESLS